MRVLCVLIIASHQQLGHGIGTSVYGLTQKTGGAEDRTMTFVLQGQNANHCDTVTPKNSS